jgi:trans-aconitate methyltransferase
MDLPLHAEAYANADFSEPNSKFVTLFSEKSPSFNGQHIVDLGCGPADITNQACGAVPQARVVGLDGADAMLARSQDHPSAYLFGQASRYSKGAYRQRRKSLGFGIICVATYSG